MRFPLRSFLLTLLALCSASPASLIAQTAGSGTVAGSVLDPSGAAVAGASVVLQNTLSSYTRTAHADATGRFQFTNIPYNPYHLIISSPGFSTQDLRVDVRSSVAVPVKAVLPIASADTVITVEAGAGDLVENSSTSHVDLDREEFAKLPLESQSSSVSSLLTLAAPGVSSDSNGLFHGLGDHAENAFYVDGQPETDQQSKVFSNQLPLSSIQSLEVIEGAPPAEFGEKTSLVANVTTRSAEGITRPRGELVGSYGSFGSTSASADLSLGGARYGNFTAIDFLNTGRFLDPAEFSVFHDKGNVENIFNRIDFQPDKADSMHLNLQLTRSWFQTPNSYDNLNVIDQSGLVVGNADQRSKIVTFNVAPSYTHTVNDNSLVTLGGWVRRDAYDYYPSRNPLADLGPIQAESVSQSRSLLNAGARADENYVKGIHNFKIGATYQQTLLGEKFSLGIVDPRLNAPCLNASGTPVAGYTSTSQCAAAGLQPNTAGFNPLLGCLDLTRPTPAASDRCASGTATPFLFLGHTDVKLFSAYAQDALTLGHFNVNVGIRGDLYNGLSIERQAEPRLGASYNFVKTGTVLRTSYARTLETPFNENLVLTQRGCFSAVISALIPCRPSSLNAGFRNEFHTGLEQSLGKHFVLNGDYLWKYTHNGYDFSVLGATPITFPIEWHNSKITGFAVRASVPNVHGFTAFVVMSSVSARFFPPQVGGLGATNASGRPFRIDHDEKFNQTTSLQYQYKKTGPYFSLNWRFDSGEVAGNVPFAVNSSTPVDLSGLTGDEQLQAGLLCGNVAPTLTHPLVSCAPSQFHSSLVSIPQPGTENDDHNPPRISARNLFDLSLGQDRLFPHLLTNEAHTLSARLTVVNLTNKLALYNFLSTFSGTHYVTPRALTAEIGYHF